jgi:DNA-binding response OmpR family regulator
MNINSAPVKTSHAEGQTDSRLTVLIVDDSKVIRLALNKILKKDFEVIQASDGEEALTCLDENSAISAIFSDVSMPNLDGFGLLEKVRTSSDDRIAKLPFIIITAKDDDDAFISRVKNAGGDDLITKPFKTNEITACINKYIIAEQAEKAEEMVELESDIPAETTSSVEPEAQPAEQVDLDVAAILGLDKHEEGATGKQDTVNAHESTLDSGVEFIVEEDFFNDTAETVTEDTVAHELTDDFMATSNNVDEFFTDIDESMLLPDSEPDSVDTTADTTIPSHSETVNSVNDSLSDANNIDWSIEEPQTVETTDISDELSLEIDFDVDDTPVVSEQPEEHIIEAAPDKKMELEQARKRAMDIAREQVEEQDEKPYQSAVEKARLATERSRIREELQKLREREITEQTYHANSATSLFGRFVRIIARLFGFRKK